MRGKCRSKGERSEPAAHLNCSTALAKLKQWLRLKVYIKTMQNLAYCLDARGCPLSHSSVLKSPQLEPHPAYPDFHNSRSASPLTPHLCSPLCSLHSSMRVILGAHNIRAKEETQQIIPVAKAIPHPAYDDKDNTSDIMLLKVRPDTLSPILLCPSLIPPTL
jgi:hypothetical protein